MGRLLDEAAHTPVRIDLHDSELMGLCDRHRDGRDRKLGATLAMEPEHLRHIHLVDVVGAKDANIGRVCVVYQVEVLEDGIGRAAVPAEPRPLLRRHGLDEVVERAGEPPGARDVLRQRLRLVLREHNHPVEARVDEVGEHEVDEPVAAGEGHRRLGPVLGEGHHPRAAATCQHHHQGTIHARRLVEQRLSGGRP